MLSSDVIRAFALFAAAANAGPCRPTTTSPGTTIEATSTATVIDSTIELSSTIVESATETETTDVPTTTAVVEEPTSTTAAEEEPTTTTVVIEGSTTTEASSTTTTAAGTEPVPCSTDDDCLADLDMCLDGLLNKCICVDAVCTIPTVIEQPTTTTAIIEGSTTTEAPSTTTTAAGSMDLPCSDNEDCTAYPDLCLDGLLNICTCGNGVCAPESGSGSVECSSSDDCANNDPDLCLDGLLNLCVCINGVCARGD
ncbi:hypothetical protein ACHAPO_008948 [Fusarium lateritium]